jgi:L,D-transpeptidase YcbB
MYFSNKIFSSVIVCLLICTAACNSKKVSEEGYEIVKPSEKDEDIQSLISTTIDKATKDSLNIDSISLNYYSIVKNYYNKTENLPIWSSNQSWTAAGISLYNYLQNAALQGLFSADYNFAKIKSIKNTLDADSLKKLPQDLWSNADILMTDALVGLLKDLKQGRMVDDSLSWKNDTSTYNKYFGTYIEKAKHTNNLDSLLELVQPKHEGYVLLKKGIKKFVDSMDNRSYTYVNYPAKDSASFTKSIKKRLNEAGITIDLTGIVKTVPDSVRRFNPDSIAISNALKIYQKREGITADGKVGAAVVKRMNTSDKQKFNTIAITLDRYKLLPEKMPEKYIWVNLPAYYLKVYEKDSVALESKVIVGKPATATPIITSTITDIMLYPTWTVPTSIITKDMLPGLKRNSNYLARRGLYLLNGRGKKIDAGSINWDKYSKGIPFAIQQGSGNSNALGVIKFNFDNPYSVYLHDTNQRYLFKNGVRCLSHGCVRVQEWQKLADYLVRNDSLNLKAGDSLSISTDSIRKLMAQKINKKIVVKEKVALFIRYFGCELVDGSIKFYDDIYYDDRDMKQKYFASK